LATLYNAALATISRQHRKEQWNADGLAAKSILSLRSGDGR
jgi:hypothetical protein